MDVSVREEAFSGDRQIDSFLMLDTNLTSVKIPLVAFDGRLKQVSLISFLTRLQ